MFSLLNRMESYMMVCNKMQTEMIKDTQELSQHLGIIPIAAPIPQPEPRTKQDDWFHPKQHDSLFWCLYLVYYGYNDYALIERNSGVKELEIKQKVAEQIKRNTLNLRNSNYKITKATVQEVLSDLLTSQKETSIHCMLAVLAYFNINLIILDHTERFMLEFVSDTSGESIPTFLIKKTAKNRYSIQTSPLTLEEMNVLKKEKIHLENCFKPMKSQSAYKITELEELAAKVGISSDGKKLKKNDLYEKLMDVIKI